MGTYARTNQQQILNLTKSLATMSQSVQNQNPRFERERERERERVKEEQLVDEAWIFEGRLG